MNTQHSSEKTYVFGQKRKDNDGLLSIGKFYALDGSFGKNIFLDAQDPHIISIFGKRGYGKSYTLGVFIEEIANLKDTIKNDICVVIIDTLGIYWTMRYPNRDEKEILHQWNLEPESIEMNIFAPQIPNVRCDKDELTSNPLSIPAHHLSAELWCQLFDVSPTSPFGIGLIQTIYRLKENGDNYTLKDIFYHIKKNPSLTKETKDIADNFYYYAKSLGIFLNKKRTIDTILKPGTINIIDISTLPGIHIKQIITGIISELLFQKRMQARRNEELDQIHKRKKQKFVPKVWMAIDEAQVFLPKKINHFCKMVLIEHWLRQGRQPGLSLILATQQPSALDWEVFSHSDLIFCHRLTSQQDIQALHQIRPSYMHESIASVIEKMGHEKGVCNVIDDTLEQVHICKIRPRKSWHGGNEPRVGNIQINETEGVIS